MNKIKKILNFEKIEISWFNIILFSIIVALVSAILKIIPFLENTSFQDIAISYECWILFAIIIIVNSDKWYEAVLKTFVFFLISQPLIYLFQVPFSKLGFKIFMYYSFWFKMTILTIPGSFIAYQVKRNNILSMIILSIATCFLAYIGVTYAFSVYLYFPNHLLSCMFCFILAFWLIRKLISNKIYRIVGYSITLISLILSIYFQKTNMGTFLSYSVDKNLENYTYKIDNPDLFTFSFDSETMYFNTKKDGETRIIFTNEDGNTYTYRIVVSKLASRIDVYEE